jgi:hypothetical protein
MDAYGLLINEATFDRKNIKYLYQSFELFENDREGSRVGVYRLKKKRNK